MISEKTIGRLSMYRRLLDLLVADGTGHVFSRQLALMAGATAAQVRRDLMALNVTGCPARGYDTEALRACIGEYLDHSDGQAACLVGIGNLGRALLAHFQGRRPKLRIAAAFDKDSKKTNRVIHGYRCYSMEELERCVREENLRIGIITVPESDARDVADKLVNVGIVAILNFAPVRLRVPGHVYVEDIDITMSLEKVAFFAQRAARKETEDA